jgi:hypothetical protein
VLSAESGAHTVKINIHEPPATASEINFLARLMIEQVAGNPASTTPAVSGSSTGASKATSAPFATGLCVLTYGTAAAECLSTILGAAWHTELYDRKSEKERTIWHSIGNRLFKT